MLVVVAPVPLPKPVEDAEVELRFLRDVANDASTIVRGSLRLADPTDSQRTTPMSNVLLRMSLDDHRMEITSNRDGSFSVSAVPSGAWLIEPVLPEHLTLPHTVSARARGLCDLRAFGKFVEAVFGVSVVPNP